MLRLDTVTTILLTIANVLVMLLILLHTYFTRKTYPGFLLWIAGMACWFSGGVFSYLFRGTLGQFWVVVVGNSLLLSLPVLFNEGLSRFYVLPTRWWRFPFNLAMLFIAWVLLYYYTMVVDSLAVRGIIISAGFGLFFLRAAVEPLLCAPDSRRHSMQWLLSISMIPLSFLHFMRLPYFISHPNLRDFAEMASNDQHLLLSIILANSVIMVITYSCLSLTGERIEGKLRQAEQQAHSVAEGQRELFKMVTHEFKTPLAVIDRSAQMISFRAVNPDEALTRRVATIRTTTAQLIGLLDDYMNDAVMARGALHPAIAYLHLPALLKEVLSHFAEIRPDRRIILATSEDFPVCKGDKRLLMLLFRNLLDNAVKFSADDTPVQVTLDRSGQTVHITVSDIGIGIPPEEINLLGEQSFRAGNTRHIAGHGIGLHTSRLIAQLHQGDIYIQSTLSEGTSVTVELPL